MRALYLICFAVQWFCAGVAWQCDAKSLAILFGILSAVSGASLLLPP
jgi:hypothetical protein